MFRGDLIIQTAEMSQFKPVVFIWLIDWVMFNINWWDNIGCSHDDNMYAIGKKCVANTVDLQYPHELIISLPEVKGEILDRSSNIALKTTTIYRLLIFLTCEKI